MKWISVLDRLPEIKEGNYGVSCTILMYDEHYAACGNNGYSTSRASFDKGTQEFLQHHCFCGKGNPFDSKLGNWMPTCDLVTHWLEIEPADIPREPNREELEDYYTEFHNRPKLNEDLL